MRRSVLALFGAGLLFTPAVHAQAPREDISFDTFDKVTIKGNFYPGGKGVNSPTVLILHKYGSDRTKGDWDALAKRLQAKNYSVLTFDFRGHGASVNVDNQFFWANPNNKAHISKSNDPNKKVISYKDFKSSYFPYLINDIAAARLYLDKRNDARECNTANLIVIGAEEGASLGLVWMMTEHLRPSIAPNLLGTGNRMANEDLSGAIWLSIVHAPRIANGTVTMPYSPMVGQLAANMRARVPMWFACGDKDTTGCKDAQYFYRDVLKADTAKDKLPDTYYKPITGTQLRGVSLLGQTTLDTENLIEKYLEKLVQRRANAAWENRDASKMPPPQVPLQQYFSNLIYLP